MPDGGAMEQRCRREALSARWRSIFTDAEFSASQRRASLRNDEAMLRASECADGWSDFMDVHPSKRIRRPGHFLIERDLISHSKDLFVVYTEDHTYGSPVVGGPLIPRCPVARRSSEPQRIDNLRAPVNRPTMGA